MLVETEIKHEEYYKCLGVKINNDGRSMEKIASRLNRGNTGIRRLNRGFSLGTRK